MAIPDYQTIMLPLLKFISDQKEHQVREMIDYLAGEFRLSDEEGKRLLPSGNDIIFDNKVKWARLYIGKAGLLESTKTGYWKSPNVVCRFYLRIHLGLTSSFLDSFPNTVNGRR